MFSDSYAKYFPQNGIFPIKVEEIKLAPSTIMEMTGTDSTPTNEKVVSPAFHKMIINKKWIPYIPNDFFEMAVMVFSKIPFL